MEDVTVTVVQPPSILPVQLKHEIPDPQQPENADEMRAEEIVDETDKENDRTLENTDNVSDNKSEKEANNRKETLPGVEKEEEPKSGEQAKRRKTPGLQVGRKSPGGVSAIKYPASILHNTYQYQRRERERRRRQKARMTDSGLSPSSSSFFPKVPHKPSTYQPTFDPNTYASRTHPSLPKIHGVGATANSSTSTYLPSLTQTFGKNQKSKNMRVTKTIYGNYQLPSIDRR
ncbi:hypothetical protein LSH36_195g07031 [Paralvinella palmiformis]|uniref:Uncharacterized protein n=1 Tax=Paralvinella palmiformis TaxID=53620 RepID=A0AAD9JQU3_9ANNE|nr:hypothetical protein LSH36_195g07031 [Paralvinella palmiformis]